MKLMPAPLPAPYKDTPMFLPCVPEPDEIVMTRPQVRSHMPSIVDPLPVP